MHLYVGGRDDGQEHRRLFSYCREVRDAEVAPFGIVSIVKEPQRFFAADSRQDFALERDLELRHPAGFVVDKRVADENVIVILADVSHRKSAPQTPTRCNNATGVSRSSRNATHDTRAIVAAVRPRAPWPSASLQSPDQPFVHKAPYQGQLGLL